MAHAQKPDFVFRRSGRVHLNRRGASVQSTTGSWGVRISGSNAGYTMFRGSVKSTEYPLHFPVSPSLPLPYVTLYIATGALPLKDRHLCGFLANFDAPYPAEHSVECRCYLSTKCRWPTVNFWRGNVFLSLRNHAVSQPSSAAISNLMYLLVSQFV